jgi:hypothetical protein
MRFKTISAPHGESYQIPEDINVVFPMSDLKVDQLHFLAYIPWDEKYLNRVPIDFKDFFIFVLPYLKSRTTDVHTACVLSFLDELIGDQPVNRRVIAIALILHDSGWSRLSETEIADSLGYSGLKLSTDAIEPKEKHAIESVNIARKVLKEYSFTVPLNDIEISLILNAIRYHDKPEEVTRNGQVPPEIKLVVDLDHLWSFTHENFWQDTIRKGVSPQEYYDNLTHHLNDYFVTKVGKEKARQLLKDRLKEIKNLISP